MWEEKTAQDLSAEIGFTILKRQRREWINLNWNEADDWCKELNASLPDFQSKEIISEFVALVKTTSFTSFRYIWLEFPLA